MNYVDFLCRGLLGRFFDEVVKRVHEAFDPLVCRRFGKRRLGGHIAAPVGFGSVAVLVDYAAFD